MGRVELENELARRDRPGEKPLFGEPLGRALVRVHRPVFLACLGPRIAHAQPSLHVVAGSLAILLEGLSRLGELALAEQLGRLLLDFPSVHQRFSPGLRWLSVDCTASRTCTE